MCGLGDGTIHEVAEKFNEENKDLIVPSCGYTTKLVPAGWHDIHFPILEGMISTYLRMLGAVLDIDSEESYGKWCTILYLLPKIVLGTTDMSSLYPEGYVKKAVQRGLETRVCYPLWLT